MVAGAEAGQHEERAVVEEYSYSLALGDVVVSFDIGGSLAVNEVDGVIDDIGEFFGIDVHFQSSVVLCNGYVVCGDAYLIDCAVIAHCYAEFVVFVEFAVVVEVLGDALCDGSHLIERPGSGVDGVIEVFDLIFLRDVAVEEHDLRRDHRRPVEVALYQEVLSVNGEVIYNALVPVDPVGIDIFDVVPRHCVAGGYPRDAGEGEGDIRKVNGVLSAEDRIDKVRCLRIRQSGGQTGDRDIKSALYLLSADCGCRSPCLSAMRRFRRRLSGSQVRGLPGSGMP